MLWSPVANLSAARGKPLSPSKQAVVLPGRAFRTNARDSEPEVDPTDCRTAPKPGNDLEFVKREFVGLSPTEISQEARADPLDSHPGSTLFVQRFWRQVF